MYSCFLNLSRFTLRTFPAFSCMFIFFELTMLWFMVTISIVLTWLLPGIKVFEQYLYFHQRYHFYVIFLRFLVCIEKHTHIYII